MKSVLIFLAGTTVLAWAARPLVIDEAYLGAPGSFCVEAGMAYTKDSGTTRLAGPFSVSYGLVHRVELALGIGGQMEQREEAFGDDTSVGGLGDLVADVKVLVIEDGWFSTCHAALLSVKIPTANHRHGLGSGRVDYDASWMISRVWSERWVTHLNVGYTWLGDRRNEDFSDIAYWGVAAEYRISQNWQLVAELVDDIAVEEGRSMLSGNIGARWAMRPELVFDAACGAKLSGSGPDLFGTIGLTWTFDPKRR